MSLETQLTDVFREVLAADDVGPDDHFFRRGGHSLAAMQAVVRVRERLGTRLPVSAIFEHPTPRALAALVATLPAAELESPAAPPARRASGEALSTAQRGMWFLDHAMGRRRAYLLPDAWRLRGPLDRDALRRALDRLRRRHPALRTRFTVAEGAPRREVVPGRDAALPIVDLRHEPADARTAAVRRLAAEDADAPIDLASGDLLRTALVRLADDDHVLLFTVHHIVSDAWSQRVLREDLGRLYARERQRGPAVDAAADEPPVTAEDRAIAPAERAASIEYWERQLADVPALDLPTDHRRTAVWSDRGGEIVVDLGDAAPIESAAAGHGVTVQMLLVAAFQALLARYAQQRDFGVATFVSTREGTGAEAAVGLFVNTVVLRADLSGDPSFVELLQRVRRTSLAAYDHRALPFEELVARLRPDRDEGATPLARVAFQYLPFPDAPPALEGLDVSLWSNRTTRVRFDVEITVRRTAEARLEALLGYSLEVFDAATMQRFARHFAAIVPALIAAPEASVFAVDALSAADRAEQLDAWSGASALPGTRGLVHALVAAEVRAHPESPALVFGSRVCTYGELGARARALSRRLRDAGIGAGDVVALHLDRSVEFVVAMLGVLDAGAAYLPIDPADPLDRRVFLVTDTGAKAVIGGPDVPAPLVAAAPLHVGVPEAEAADAEADADLPPAPVAPGDRAYVMYTSGSTGRPKGVAVTHQGITRLVLDTTYVRFTPDDGVAFASNLAFDAATFEIWGALMNGARVVHVDRDTLLSPPAFGALVRDRGVTIMFMTSALFRLMAGLAPDVFATLRTLIVGGDVVDPVAARAVLDAGAPGRLVNGYGPTENTTFSATYDIGPEHPPERAIPIGRPITGSTAYVLDERRALLPVGARGELYVGGTGLAHGYVGRPELTAERFVPHPFTPGERLYRTGDTVRWRADGVLEFLGRTDRQVKLRGFRIELDEVEQVVGQHADVGAAVVLLHRAGGLDRLVAYVTRRPGTAPSGGAIRAFLAERLPAFMVPDAIDVLDVLPLTPNGKVDQAALRRRPWPAEERAIAAEAPTHATLLPAVRDACREVLDGAPIGADDSFFAAGGTSLAVLRLIERVRASTGRQLLARDVFAHPTPAALAAHLATVAPSTGRAPLIEIARGDGSRPPLYFPPGLLGDGVIHQAFGQALPPGQAVSAFQEPDDAPLDTSMQAMAARLCAVVTAAQPHGPLSLSGYSFSGLLAYEMARQLRAAGREIAVLAILDTGPDQADDPSLSGRATRLWSVLANLPRWVTEDVVRAGDWRLPLRWARSARKLLRGVGRAEPAQAAAAVPRADDLFDVADWPETLRRRVDHHLRLIETFEYLPYDGEIVLLRARVRPLLHAHTRDLGWTAIAARVRIIDVPGNHVTMTQEPHVREVAARLREVLEGAAAASGPTRR